MLSVARAASPDSPQGALNTSGPSRVQLDPLPYASITVPGLTDPIQLQERLGKDRFRTTIYTTSHPDILVKIFHLNAEGGTRRVEIEGDFRMEIGNYLALAEPSVSTPFKGFVPKQFAPQMHAYGRGKNGEYGYIAMEFVRGQNLIDWRHQQPGGPRSEDFHALGSWLQVIVGSFRANGIVLMDLKLENIILRAPASYDNDIPVKVIDMGDLLMGRHNNPHKLKMFPYCTTIGYAEAFENLATLHAGRFLGVDTDLFSMGVALFELATGEAHFPVSDKLRTHFTPEALEALANLHQHYLSEFPHLSGHFRDIHTQLKENALYFETFWQLLQYAHAAHWDPSEPEERQRHILDVHVLPIGSEFIAAALPEPLRWAAESIARATAPKQARFADIEELDCAFSAAYAQSQSTGV